ncbi:hypothetical protein LOC67_21620 [Stieleria sp. JC731]|uniref:PVC-type heme-binding CxxCH protein n=1 Tax=Pirellulaceae TaxID=2691357 RepID=UPI001E61EF5F|nr:PVC-type heme-binding CxxCH protein [Stieleria sp. JC731]MCC9603157.1 hypothetical protein [Stieleria sp. JC731]
MNWFRVAIGVALCNVLLPIWPLSAVDLVPPVIVEEGWEIELVKAEPDIVTPVMCVCDHEGRLLVIESHTHFPPEGYDGPDHDRIIRLSDSNGDGTLDRREVFFDQGKFTMGLAILDDNWIAVTHRDKVLRIRDADGDGQAEQVEVLAELDTNANYPHNGLGGLVAAADGWLYVGQGENFGEDYQLVGKDGRTQKGGGEGGNIFRIRFDGTQLERFATGFWNPFGMCFDSADRLWCVGNDPDAMPPCRLMHVVRGGDYGFEFQFGRGGTHPLQSWMGELPVTMPPAAGTGEAPCAVVPIGDRLWVSSWGDNRVEAYRLRENGGTWVSETETVLQGDTLFRPVGIALAPDHSIYITDWVRRDYSVHQTGRIWRLKPVSGKAASGVIPGLSSVEKESASAGDEMDLTALLQQATDNDVFVAQAAITRLAELESLPSPDEVVQHKSPQKLALMAAWRWRELCDRDSLTEVQRRMMLSDAFEDLDEDTTLFGLRWAAERKDRELVAEIQQVLKRDLLTTRLFEVAVATISFLENGTARSGVRDPAREKLLAELASDQTRSPEIRALAIQRIPAAADQPGGDQITAWVKESESPQLQRESVRLLIDRGTEADAKRLHSFAVDSSLPIAIRADAISGLSNFVASYESGLRALEMNASEPNEIREEARRVLSRIEGSNRQKRPAVDDFDAWFRLVGNGGDAEAGARVFQRATCSKCHLSHGRGAMTGPDLTNLVGQPRKRLLRSILYPSEEVGPLYVPWKIVTTEGNVLIGLKTPTPGVGGAIGFQAADGSSFSVKLEDIEFHSFSDQSIMPKGLEQTLSIGELRDLLAYLESTETD